MVSFVVAQINLEILLFITWVIDEEDVEIQEVDLLIDDIEKLLKE